MNLKKSNFSHRILDLFFHFLEKWNLPNSTLENGNSQIHESGKVSNIFPFGIEVQESGVGGVLSNSISQQVEAEVEQNVILLGLAGSSGASPEYR